MVIAYRRCRVACSSLAALRASVITDEPNALPSAEPRAAVDLRSCALPVTGQPTPAQQAIGGPTR